MNYRNIEKIEKMVKKMNYYNADQFINDAKVYLKAIKDGRMLVNIVSVSSSGMSRKMRFMSCEKSKTGYYYRNYNQFLKALGYTVKGNVITVQGCGMSMVFAANYDIVHSLCRLGLCTKKQCETLAQKTPATI